MEIADNYEWHNDICESNFSPCYKESLLLGKDQSDVIIDVPLVKVL